MYRSLTAVTTSATASRLATIAALRTELGDEAASRSDDELGALLDQASDQIARFCNRVFGRQTIEQTIRTDEAPAEILLAAVPVVSVASVTEDGAAVDDADYEFDAATGQLYRLDDDEPAAWLAAKTVITFTAGWLLPEEGGANLPASVSRAAVLLAASDLYGQGRDPWVKSESVEGIGSISLVMPSAGAPWMPPAVTELLRPFVLEAVG